MENTNSQCLMDEKQHLLERGDTLPSNRRHRPEPARARLFDRLLPVLLLISAVLLLFRSFFVCHHRHDPSNNLLDSTLLTEGSKKKVAFEAHIMSKCPDARDCLQKLVVPTMENISDKVDFKLSYIAKVDPDNDDVNCMHGPSECLGNIIQLCAAKIYPDPKLYLGFANCMTSNYSEIPKRSLIEGCALEHGINFQQINDCISDEGHGMDLLRSSAERSVENNVTKSCTVRVAGKIRCIRDGGEWYDCPGGSDVSDLVHDIQKIYEES